MIYNIEEEEMRKPQVLGPRSVGLAVALHVVAFLLLYLFAMLHLKPRETVIPIDLTVVVNENLDGEENEPPPLDNPPPKVEPPKPAPPPPEPPKVEEKVEAVEQIVEKPKPKPKEEKPKEKPKEEKKPDPPKTKAERDKEREERYKKMRESTTVVKPKIVVKNQPSGNGKTDKQNMSEAEIRKRLNEGYKPGTSNQLTESEAQRCISLIRSAFYAKWNRPPWTADLKEMHLKVKFGDNGRVLGYQMEKSSGDAKADATVLQAAALVPSVPGLSLDFLTKNPTVTIRFKVTPQ